MLTEFSGNDSNNLIPTESFKTIHMSQFRSTASLGKASVRVYSSSLVNTLIANVATGEVLRKKCSDEPNLNSQSMLSVWVILACSFKSLNFESISYIIIDC